MLFATAKKRISIISIIICLILGVIGIKLTYLTIYRNNNLTSLAVKLWQRSFPLEASRGDIYDRNGNVIASSLPTMSVAIIPYQVNDFDVVSGYLATILNSNKDTIYNKINKRVCQKQ